MEVLAGALRAESGKILDLQATGLLKIMVVGHEIRTFLRACGRNEGHGGQAKHDGEQGSTNRQQSGLLKEYIRLKQSSINCKYLASGFLFSRPARVTSCFRVTIGAIAILAIAGTVEAV